MQKLKNVFGFTFIELMVAVLIVGIVSAIAYPLYINSVEKALGAKAVENLHCIRTALINFFVENTSYTNNLATLQTYNQFSQNDGDWQYTVVVVNDPGPPKNYSFTITASRLVGRFINQTITLTHPYKQAPTITYPGGFNHWPPV
ncbi:MAG: prepilin-type N-terminal cleavage/methylation domain-containing protein [Candidatus Omnitrophica bacterium]|nr:prepilin-type N-terminal cleavage/methylation domain-containing protein [Candidatus Omnitrophota bacterium]MBU4479701.1 prepilin-type N-terminal cleavage/methylation domain-containing protein [Candidatus Omnitrophota bacterium]MCG2703509.1 prepilin-type N-terminal cleavage/methylation domain-containing protein [Candidatus Omnitrophota bacterium]